MSLLTHISDIWSAGRIKPIVDSGQTKLVIMNPRVDPQSCLYFDSLTVDNKTLSETARAFIEENDILLRPHTLSLDYNFWTAGIASSTHISLQMKSWPPLFPPISRKFRVGTQL